MKRNRPVTDTQDDDGMEESGSPQTGGPGFLAIGRLRRPHGIDGEINMEILTDFPERIRARRIVFVGDEHEKMRITHVRRHDRALLITFEGLESEETVGRLRNKIVYTRAVNLPDLPEGEYYHHQLLGMRVVTEDEKEIGFLSEILETGANDVYLIQSPDGQETLLPAIADVVLEVNVERREMRVRLPEWY